MNKPAYNPAQKNTTIADPNAPSKGGKNVDPRIVAGAIGGAAIIGGGTAVAMSLNGEDETTDPDANAPESLIGEDDFNPDVTVNETNFTSILGSLNDSAEATEHTAHHTPHTPHAQHAHVNIPRPSAQAHTEEQHSDIEASEDVIDTTPVSADEVIALTEVDVNDNDIPELLSFESVELIPNDEDGSVQIQAEFTMEGERYTMIDVDNDGVFDSVADVNGEAQGGAGGMMLSDIELINNENNDDYLAASDYDNNSDISGTGESAIDDTIIV